MLIDAGALADVLALRIDDANSILLGVSGLMIVLGFSYYPLVNAGSARQKTLNTDAFGLASVLLGFFTMGPYLALREYVPSITKEEAGSTIVRRALESVIPGLITVVGGLVCYSVALSITAPGEEYRDVLVYSTWVDFLRLLATERWANVVAANVAGLAIAVYDPLVEDMKRRGWSFKGKERLESVLAALSIIALPGLGVGTYLLLRPSLPSKPKRTKPNASAQSGEM